MLVSISKILPFKIKSLGLESAMKWRQFRDEWDEILKEALNPGWRGKSRPIKLMNKILVVDCLNSVLASELRLNQNKILKKIPQFFKKDIETIKFVS